MLTRRQDWQRALDSFVREHQTDHFAYGKWDCCLFVCDAIQAMTGVDTAAWFRGKYKSRTAALRLVREFAGSASIKAVAEKITADYRMEPMPLTHARRGDLVLIPRAKDYSLGIVSLNGLDIMVLATEGISRVPLTNAVKAWRV